MQLDHFIFCVIYAPRQDDLASAKEVVVWPPNSIGTDEDIDRIVNAPTKALARLYAVRAVDDSHALHCLHDCLDESGMDPYRCVVLDVPIPDEMKGPFRDVPPECAAAFQIGVPLFALTTRDEDSIDSLLAFCVSLFV